MRAPFLTPLLALSVFAAAMAQADTVISPDITVDLGGLVVFDDEVAEDVAGVAGLIAIGSPGDIPEETDINGFDQLSGDKYFTTDTTVELPGGVTATPAMVISENGGVYTVEFDGTVLPAGVTVDAVFAFSNGDLALSFDTTAEVSGTTFDDEDVLSLDTGTTTWTMHYDGSASFANLAPVDVVAVPEPGTAVALIAGALFTAGLVRSRRS